MRRKDIVRKLADRHTTLCTFELHARSQENTVEAGEWKARRFELRATAQDCFGITAGEIEEASGFPMDQLNFWEHTQKKVPRA